MALSCNRCGHEFTEQEEYKAFASTNECPSCGASISPGLKDGYETDEGETPYSNDRKQDHTPQQ